MKKLFIWIIVILIIAAFALLYFSPSTRNLYVYSAITIRVEMTEAEKEEIISTFKNLFLFYSDDGYYLYNPSTGLGWNDKDLKENVGDELIVDFNKSGNFAYFEIEEPNSGESIMITFFKASLKERITFVSRYYSWS